MQLIYKLLQSPDDWEYEDDVYYHKLYPQYTLKNSFDYEREVFNEDYREENPAMYHYVQCDRRTHYGRISIFHYSTKLYSCQSSSLDGSRALVPCPECEFLHLNNQYFTDATIRYYLEDSIDWKLLCFFKNKKDKTTGSEAAIAIRKHMNVILLFSNAAQRDSFVQYILKKKEIFENKKLETTKEINAIAQLNSAEKDSLLNAYTFNALFKEWKITPHTTY